MPYKDPDKRREYNRNWARKRKEETGSWPPPKEGWKEYNRTWKISNPQQYLLTAAKSRAKRLGLEFSITKEDIVIPEFCPVLGIKLEYSISKRTANTPSLDKINPDKGYTKDNICVISWRANELKSDASLEELENLVRYIKEPRVQPWQMEFAPKEDNER